jgi:hypothetical protein
MERRGGMLSCSPFQPRSDMYVVLARLWFMVVRFACLLGLAGWATLMVGDDYRWKDMAISYMHIPFLRHALVCTCYCEVSDGWWRTSSAGRLRLPALAVLAVAKDCCCEKAQWEGRLYG